MLRMTQLYDQTFGASGEQATTLDGVENCVCKNLHQELFSSLAPESEQEYNEKVCHQITNFRFFVTPAMLELPAKRLSEERVQQAV